MTSTARAEFLRTLSSLRRATELPQVLVSNPPDAEHDGVARLLRNGLAISAFATLEAFVSDRTSELLHEISQGTVAFNDLPKGLQIASTQQVVQVLGAEVQRRIRAEEDPTTLIQDTARALTSTGTANLELSPLSLRWPGSNLSSSDIASILTRLGIGGDAWAQLTMVARGCGFNVTALQRTFTGMMRQRHQAAHEARYEASVIAVRALPNSALALAVGFDALASRAARLCKLGDTGYLGGAQVLANQIALRKVIKVGARWKEYNPNQTARARRVYASRDDALNGAVAAGQADRHDLVVEFVGGQPVTWVTSDVP